MGDGHFALFQMPLHNFTYRPMLLVQYTSHVKMNARWAILKRLIR